MLCTTLLLGLLAAPQVPDAPVVHSVCDISQEFTFYMDGRFHRQYLAGHGRDARNWGSLAELDLGNANLLVLTGGDRRIPYAAAALDEVEEFLRGGGTVLLMADGAADPPPGAALAARFGADLAAEAAKMPLVMTAALGELTDQADEGLVFRGGTVLDLGEGWRPLLHDARARPVLALRDVGPGHLLVGSRGLFGQNPDASDPINAAWVTPLLVGLAASKPVDPERPHRSTWVECEEQLGPLTLEYHAGTRPFARAIADEYEQIRPHLVAVTGVEPAPGMIKRLLILPTGGGGFSSGERIAIGAFWGGYPESRYGMVELISHEAGHSWVLPYTEPLWNEPIATYLGIQVGLRFGLAEAQKTLDRQLERGRAHDPDYRSADPAADGAPRDLVWGKSYFVFEELERLHGPGALASYFRTKRRVLQPGRAGYGFDDCVAVWSLAVGEDLFGWFRSLGFDVDRGRTDLPEPRQDLLVADFEGEDYGAWRGEGEAFGPGPAPGTLPNQMAVSGYQGEGLVNTFFEGDRTTGRLTSPPILLERDYLTFLIGGGGHAGKTCMNLLDDGQVVRSATGPNLKPGGSERLELQAWDVRELRGRSVVLEIVDAATGGWGHVNVDQIVQTDVQPRVPDFGPRARSFTVDSRYLVLPIHDGARATEVVLEVDGAPVRRYSTELASSPDEVDWYAYFRIDAYRGRPARVTAKRATGEVFALVRQADAVPGSGSWYGEALRPQLHFTQAVGWNNDPNGMVYLDGEWHLFFQHNPVGWSWGNMTWGHAVSDDLLHWQQLPNVLFPSTMAQGACFSGSGLVDVRNTAGWATGDQDVLVAFLTDTGAGESVAYSTDRGRTFTWYEGNPVVAHKGRDPKVIWYSYGVDDEPLDEAARELGGHWVMAVYDEGEEHGRNIAFYTSVDLKDWREQSHLPGYYECPELFALPVDGDPDDRRWVVFAADARYALGRFDGRRFTPAHEGKHQLHWGAYYASQTFSDAPGGRRIQIGWVRIATPGMPFNQTFSFPHELTLRTTGDGLRMFAEPVQEIEGLGKVWRDVWRTNLALVPDDPVGLDVDGELLDVRATFELDDAERVGLRIGGDRIVYEVADQKLGEAPLAPVDGRITIRVLVDRTMFETGGNHGRVVLTAERGHKGDIDLVEAFAEGGAAQLVEFEIVELESIWRR